MGLVLNRLYTTSTDDQIKELKHSNVIKIVGAVGLHLKDYPGILEKVRDGLLQKFGSPPSSLDFVIVEQLMNIALIEKVRCV